MRGSYFIYHTAWLSGDPQPPSRNSVRLIFLSHVVQLWIVTLARKSNYWGFGRWVDWFDWTGQVSEGHIILFLVLVLLHQKTDFFIIISPPWYDPGCCWGVKPQYTKPINLVLFSRWMPLDHISSCVHLFYKFCDLWEEPAFPVRLRQGNSGTKGG